MCHSLLEVNNGHQSYCIVVSLHPNHISALSMMMLNHGAMVVFKAYFRCFAITNYSIKLFIVLGKQVNMGVNEKSNIM